jgi:AcrR family transcriptional regulator
MTTWSPTTSKAGPRRRATLLDAALTVFARHGYRKASMDEIARVAGVSRQGLYLNFADKEDLFRASVQHHYAGALSAATASLLDKARPIDERLVAAFDEWLGRYVGIMGADTSELIADTTKLTGSIMSDHRKRFEQAVAKAITDSPLKGAYAATGLTALQLARTLDATARGIKEVSASREEFVERLVIGVRVLCASVRIGASASKKSLHSRNARGSQ